MDNTIKLPNGERLEKQGKAFKHFDSQGRILGDSSSAKPTPNEIMTMQYFFLMGEEERETVYDWFFEVTPQTENQQKFIERVEKALNKIKEDYRIATMEPSFDKKGGICYGERKKVATNRTGPEWETLAINFCNANKWYSGLATLEEGDIFKAYRVAKGFWSLSLICDASTIGNYKDSPTATGSLELSGNRKVAGFISSVGNTYEIFRAGQGYALVGGTYEKSGSEYPIANVQYFSGKNVKVKNGTGVVVLRR